MKDLAAIAAKYDTRRKSTCKVCALGPKALAIIRELRKTHGMSIRGISNAIEGEFGVYAAEATLHKHFTRHEGK